MLCFYFRENAIGPFGLVGPLRYVKDGLNSKLDGLTEFQPKPISTLGSKILQLKAWSFIQLHSSTSAFFHVFSPHSPESCQPAHPKTPVFFPRFSFSFQRLKFSLPGSIEILPKRLCFLLRSEYFPVGSCSTVAPSGPQALSRRKPSSSSSESPSSGPGVSRLVIRESSRNDSRFEYPFWQQNWFIGLLFVMAMGFLALALFLFLNLDVDHGSPSSASAASSPGVEITYGTVLKLMHEKTKFRLHSHDVPYGSGSGQQSVTGFPNVDDSNSYWIVRPPPGTSAKQGDSIKSGTIIRLQHMRTRKWLHSHLHASPISGNLEISCFGGETESDTGDHWRLIIEGSGKIWKQDQRIRLQHVDTGGFLHSHDKKYTRIAGGQQEVCGVREKRPDNIWLAAEGIYLPVTETK